jgi:hypothetical protein
LEIIHQVKLFKGDWLFQKWNALTFPLGSGDVAQGFRVRRFRFQRFGRPVRERVRGIYINRIRKGGPTDLSGRSERKWTKCYVADFKQKRNLEHQSSSSILMIMAYSFTFPCGKKWKNHFGF